MLAAFYYNNHDVRVEEIPIPSIGEDEVLLKVMASGICGSDVMEWYRIPKAPRVLGHEATGIISKVGSKVNGIKSGDRVFVSHHVPMQPVQATANAETTPPATPFTQPTITPAASHNTSKFPKSTSKYGIYKLPRCYEF